MHRSRLYGLFLDTPAPAATGFWIGALGTRPETPAGDPLLIRLAGARPGLDIEINTVDDAPNWHIGIETDDVEAESARLIRLGAVAEADHDAYRLLRAPGGHLITVLPVQSTQRFFATSSKVWP
ncbi:VOC family protein [Actinoplanes sp. NPDC051851]|uniref:VOC family protein n=1 Tax=Actinoplanes sp. NPDC051851 TaxID=3154753 RepID=UPI00343EA023